MMTLLQSSPEQHTTAHSSRVSLRRSPLKKPPTAAQAAFLSVISNSNNPFKSVESPFLCVNGSRIRY